MVYANLTRFAARPDEAKRLTANWSRHVAQMQTISAAAVRPLNSAGAREQWVNYAVVALLAMIAPAYAIMSWTVPYRQTYLRDLAFPVLAVEFLLVSVLLLNIGSFTQKLRQADRAAIGLTLAWFASAGVSMLLARADPSAARFHVLVNLLHVLCGFLLACRMTTNDRLRSWLVWALAGSIACYTVIVVVLSMSVPSTVLFDFEKFGAGVTNLRQLAFYALILTGLAGALLARSTGRQQQAAASVLLLFGCFLCFWSGARGAMGALVVQQAVLIVSASAGRRTYVRTLVACLAIAMPMSTWLAPTPQYGVTAIGSRIAAQTPGQGYSSGRSEMWRQTAEAIVDRPLFGHGEAQFKREIPAGRGAFNHPHNVFLQLLYQWGAIGTLLIAALLARLTGGVDRVRAAVRDRAGLAGISVIVGLGAASLLDGPFFHTYPTLMAAVSVALYHTSGRSHGGAETSHES